MLKESGCEEPNFVEMVSPDRTSLTLYGGNNEGLENIDVRENVLESSPGDRRLFLPSRRLIFCPESG